MSKMEFVAVWVVTYITIVTMMMALGNGWLP